MRLSIRFGILFLLCCLILILGLMTGPVSLSLSDIVAGILGTNSQAELIVLQLRLPRVLMALLSGAILSLSGFFMQALVRNPLADPFILGLSSGAGFGVNLMVLGLAPVSALAMFSFPLAAFVGGLLSMAILFSLVKPSQTAEGFRVLLAGIAVSSLFTALTGLLIYLFAEDDQVRRFLFWTFGDLSHTGYEGVWPCLVVLIMGQVWGIAKAPALDVMAQGHKTATALGLSTKRLSLTFILITTLMAGTAISFTGPIGFVGMMIPHFLRAWLGDLHRPNLWLAGLAGGAYLAFCDILSQWLYPPAGLPIGIVTALFGVPFFLYLLAKSK